MQYLLLIILLHNLLKLSLT